MAARDDSVIQGVDADLGRASHEGGIVDETSRLRVAIREAGGVSSVTLLAATVFEERAKPVAHDLEEQALALRRTSAAPGDLPPDVNCALAFALGVVATMVGFWQAWVAVTLAFLNWDCFDVLGHPPDPA